MDLIQGFAACVDGYARNCLGTDLLVVSLNVIEDIGQNASYNENFRLEKVGALVSWAIGRMFFRIYQEEQRFFYRSQIDCATM